MKGGILRALRRRADLRFPVTIVVLAVLYAAMGIAALSVAVGATAFVWSHVGAYAAAVVGGAVTFAVSYVGVRVVDAVTSGGNE